MVANLMFHIIMEMWPFSGTPHLYQTNSIKDVAEHVGETSWLVG
jgi:hypothetical protein